MQARYEAVKAHVVGELPFLRPSAELAAIAAKHPKMGMEGALSAHLEEIGAIAEVAEVLRRTPAYTSAHEALEREARALALVQARVEALVEAMYAHARAMPLACS